MKNKLLDQRLLTIAVLGSLVLINLVGFGVSARLDLTRGRQFTLSPVTRDTLAGLVDPVTIRAYFSRDLPPPYSTTSLFAADLLEEYYEVAGGMLRYEFVDPASGRTDVESVQAELRKVGIPPIQIRVIEADQQQDRRAFMGMVVALGDRKTVIPIVSDTVGLEHDLTAAIRTLHHAREPRIALLTGHGGPEPGAGLNGFFELLSQFYEVIPVDLNERAELPEDVAAVVAVGPKTPFGELELQLIDRFVAAGGSAAFLLGEVAPDLRVGDVQPARHGLAPLLAKWGVTLEEGLVLDAECANINVGRQEGSQQIVEAVRYPFLVKPRALDERNPLTRGLTEVVLPFMSPVTVENGQVLVRSSSGSWIEAPPFDLSPFQTWKSPASGSGEGTGLVVSMTRGDSRIVVAGGHQFVTEEFLSRGNEALVLNVFDWLLKDDALLGIRTRGLSAQPLEHELTEAQRNGLKYLNVVGLPVLLVGIGLVRWRRREARRSRQCF